MNWYDLTSNPHRQTFEHNCRLSSLPNDRERELAALWRLEADVNNGAYLQFLSNWGHETYAYALQALKKIGATQMVNVIEQCQLLVVEHWGDKPLDYRKMLKLLPSNVSQRILDLSYEFMGYPDDIAELGMKYYKADVTGSDNAAG